MKLPTAIFSIGYLLKNIKLSPSIGSKDKRKLKGSQRSIRIVIFHKVDTIWREIINISHSILGTLAFMENIF